MKQVKVRWYDSSNVGDAITRYMITKAGYEPIPAQEGPRLFVSGSLAQEAKPGDVIFGTGSFKSDPLYMPLDVRYVRGPNTAGVLGLRRPRFGDAAEMMPHFFTHWPATASRGCLYIAHYIDYEDAVKENPAIRIVSAATPPEDLVREICNHELVLSSALHGIILAEAYGTRAYPVHFFADEDPRAQRIRDREWKFEDYYLGTGRTPPPKLYVRNSVLSGEPAWPHGGFVMGIHPDGQRMKDEFLEVLETNSHG